MKLMIVAAIWPFFLSCSVGYAAGINILSEVHHLWGEGGAEYYLYPSVRYDVVSGETVGISVSGEYYNPDDSFPNPYQPVEKPRNPVKPIAPIPMCGKLILSFHNKELLPYGDW